MALINPASLYTGGSERVNSTPSVNFYAQLAAKKQAKDDAAAEYVRNLTTKITPTGVRSADLPAFNKMYEDWRNRGASNYKEISKNPLAKAEFDAEGQKLLSFIQESKLEEEKKKPFVDILTDPAKRAKLRVSALGAIGEHDKPLYTQDESGNLVRDYARKSLDVTGNLFKEPSFDFQKAYKGWSGTMSPGEVLGEQISKDPTTGKVRINYEKKFSPDQVAQVALNAARGIKDDPEILDYYDHKLETLSPAEFTKLNEVYQSIPGIKKQQVRPDGFVIVDEIDSPEKLAMAEAAQQAMIPHEKGTRDVTNSELAFDRRLQAMAYNSGLIQGRGGGQNQQQPGYTGNTFDDFQDADYGNGLVVKNGVWYKDGQPKQGSLFLRGQAIPAPLMSALRAGGIDPALLSKGVDAVMKDGVIQSVSNKHIGTITRQSMAGVYQPKMDTEPRYRNQLQFGGGKGQQTQGDYSDLQSGTYNGKKVTIGKKGDKWYNIKTGEEIK